MDKVYCYSCCQDVKDDYKVTPGGFTYCSHCKDNIEYCWHCGDEGYNVHSNGNTYCSDCLELTKN